MLWSACLLALVAIALLRLAWGRPRRSVSLNTAAWAVLTAALALGAAAGGAWGVAVASLAATGAAFVLLAWGGLTTQSTRSRPLQRRVRLLDSGAPLHLGRRLLTFAITVPGALIVSLALGLAARLVAVGTGMGEANGNVLTLLLVPLLWSMLMTALLMSERRAAQARLLLVPAVAGGAVLLVGLSA